ncbi:arylsulfatase [Aquimarina sp. ERC-38]|uniref:sulfatase family protein n=1 Tax=Aquimarina sp. ERC-38 TaxID=2949996 RepID=UPI0022472646|nr:arylsulfatase [Aquimarina sp. ERC-38]UZO82227.1 arylsulfatase [Aquimarina sp. ERC-38]
MKYILLLIIILTISTLQDNRAQSSGIKGKPNIIYILADDLGIGDISSFNKQGKIKTPNIDQLAKEGMRFTDAHTSSSVCTPTRYSIMTGRYNWRTVLKKGVLKGTSPALIPKKRKTIASLLQSQGYVTAFIGKWHLGWNWAEIENPKGSPKKQSNYDYSKPISHSPNDLGFDYAYGINGSLDMGPYIYVENRMPTAKTERIIDRKNGYAFRRKGLIATDFKHKEVTPNFINRSIEYIKSKKDTKQPFFLYLPLPSPHTPILPTEEFIGKSGINPYADFIMMIDTYLGTLFNTVKEQGLENNTLIIFTSDNGTSPKANAKVLHQFGHHPTKHFRGMKASIFEGGHRVPFIAKWPGVISPNSVSDQTICTTDFYATCAEILNYEIPDNEGEDSYSLVPLFKGKEISGNFREATVHHSSGGFFSIRKGDWKLILCKGDGGYKELKELSETEAPEYQLYNLAEDPSETNNLYRDSSTKYQELEQLLIKYIEEGRSTPGKVQKNDAINFTWKQVGFLSKTN